MKRFVRVLSMLLALVMMVGLLPLSVMAEEAHATHTVQFKLNYNGAKKIAAQTVADGECATEPEDATREGWILKGWYTKKNGGERFDFSAPITADVTLYAQWDEDIEYWGRIWGNNIVGMIEKGEKEGETTGTETYTVTFEANGEGVEGLPAAQTVKKGECAVMTTAPTRDGYTFEGWYTDATGTVVYDFTAKVDSNITVYAKWNGEISAEEYYKNNSVILDIVDAEESTDVLTEAEVKSVLDELGFGDYPISYYYSMQGELIDDTEIQPESDEKHPMYYLKYVSSNNIFWIVYVIDGCIYADPVSLNIESYVKVPLLLSESNFVTSYDDTTNKFYVTIPNAEVTILKTVSKINTTTLDAFTEDEFCQLIGVNPPVNDSEIEDDTESISEHSRRSMTRNVSLSTSAVENEDPFIVVSLGDSYSSGESIEPFFGQTKEMSLKVKDKNWLAHRSTRSWPSLLKVPGVTLYDTSLTNYWVDIFNGKSSDRAIQWYFGAVSGAKTINISKNINIGGDKSEEQVIKYDKNGIKGSEPMGYQIDIFDEIKGEVDLVTLTIGGNDAGFVDVLKECFWNNYLIPNQDKKLKKKIDGIWDNIGNIKEKIKTVYEDIAEVAPSAAIIVAGYPKLLNPAGGGAIIHPDEAKLINETVEDFNDELEKNIADCYCDGINIFFVDVEGEFEGNEAYTEDAWIEPIIIGAKDQDLDKLITSASSIHPKFEGAQAYAKCVNEKIKTIWENRSNVIGTVSSNYEVLPNTKVTIQNVAYSKEVYTDSTGRFKLTYIPHGTYDIIVEAGSSIYDVKTIENGVTVTGTPNDCIDVGNILLSSGCAITGVITIADADTDMTNNVPLEGAEVSLAITGYMDAMDAVATSDSNGRYTLSNIPVGTFTLTVSKDGYIPVSQRITVTEDDVEIVHNITIEAVSSEYAGVGYASGSIYDVATGRPVSGLTLYIREGLENTTGAIVGTIHMNSSTTYTTTIGLPAGNYTVQVVDERTGISEAERYITSSFNIKILGGMTIGDQNGYVSNSVASEELRVVLTWGATPYDLDSHLVGPASDGGKFHVYFGDKTYGTQADLDVDDTSSYGPETVTIHSFNSGIYTYAVHDYTNRSSSSSTALANSGAQVKVYRGAELLKTYNVPANTDGTLWTVFTYDPATKRISTVNTMSYDSTPGSSLMTSAVSLMCSGDDGAFEECDDGYEYEEAVMIILADIFESVKE